MKVMRFTRIFLVQLLLCLLLLCLSSGAPPKHHDGQPSRSFKATRYTKQEIEFIVNELLNLPSDFTLVSDTTVWETIARKMQEVRKTNRVGFPQERKANNLRDYFRYTMTKSKKCMDKFPDNLKQQLLRDLQTNRHYGGKRPYTYEEDQMIVDELLKTYEAKVPIYSRKIWANIAEQFRSKRGSPGFYEDRTPQGLHKHFMRVHLKDPNGRVKVPETLIQKFGLGGEASSSEPSSQNQQTDLQIMEDDENYWASMIEELENAPYELDFSQFD